MRYSDRFQICLLFRGGADVGDDVVHVVAVLLAQLLAAAEAGVHLGDAEALKGLGPDLVVDEEIGQGDSDLLAEVFDGDGGCFGVFFFSLLRSPYFSDRVIITRLYV